MATTDWKPLPRQDAEALAVTLAGETKVIAVVLDSPTMDADAELVALAPKMKQALLDLIKWRDANPPSKADPLWQSVRKLMAPYKT